MASSVIDTLIAEAGSDPEGLRAVAWVIQNRATQWGMTPEQVVKQKGQFEGYYKPGPKSVQAQKMPKVRAAAEKAWNEVVSGTAPDPTNGGTSFRAKGTKQPAPHGTVEIGGNVFALGSGASNSALAAINAVAPTPMPSRPVALGYSQNTAIPPLPDKFNPRAIASAAETAMRQAYPNYDAMSAGDKNTALTQYLEGRLPTNLPPLPSDNMKALQDALNAKAERMRNGTDGRPVAMPRNVPPQISAARVPAPPVYRPELTLAQRNALANPGRGVGTTQLAPATPVRTIRMGADNQPINDMGPLGVQLAQEAADREAARLRSKVTSGESWSDWSKRTAVAKPGGNRLTPETPLARPPQPPGPIGSAAINALPAIPVVGPLAVGLGTAADLVQRIAPPQASATPQPQPTKLPSVIPEKAGPPAPPRSVPKSDTSIGTFVTQFGSNTGKPAPLPPKPPKSSDRLVAGDVQKDAFVKTYYPDMYSPEAIKRGQDIASALYPKPATPAAVAAINSAPLPHLPMMPPTAMSVARLPTVPVRTAPIPAARIPLTQTRTVNPMTQIVPAVQARAGQGLLGGLFNMLTAGNVPQANTQQRQSQQYPTPIPGQTGIEINGVDLAFMPTSVQQSSRWRTGY